MKRIALLVTGKAEEAALHHSLKRVFPEAEFVMLPRRDGFTSTALPSAACSNGETGSGGAGGTGGAATVDPDETLMTELVGTWEEVVHDWTANTCPVDVSKLEGIGWYLLITRDAPTTGTVRLCRSLDAQGGCLDEDAFVRGKVVVANGKATWSYDADFSFFDDLDCLVHEATEVDLVLEGDRLTATNVAVVSIVGGAQCAETEAKLQAESGLDYPLEGCGGTQHNELVRVK